ncbi:MAG TPA: hypothetical protein VMW35_00035 [Myxococcota bacterium]|nr:hypothetical protein [Myxococcota bacterium]
MSGPRMKGLLLVGPVADVTRLAQDGRISREEIEAELGPDARKIVADGVSIVSWYAPEVYRDLARLLMKLEGKGPRDTRYLRERGEKAGRRLVESGLYQQLDFLKRRTRDASAGPLTKEVFEHTLRLVVSMQAALLQGCTWTVVPDPDHADRLQIEVTDVEGLPDETAEATCGLLTGIALHSGSTTRWTYERPTPGRIVYRMDRDVSQVGRERGGKRA